MTRGQLPGMRGMPWRPAMAQEWVKLDPATTPRTGMPDFKPYVYRGTGVDTLTPWMDDEPDEVPSFVPKECGTAAAARRHRRHGEPLDEACRQAERNLWATRKARRAA